MPSEDIWHCASERPVRRVPYQILRALFSHDIFHKVQRYPILSTNVHFVSILLFASSLFFIRFASIISFILEEITQHSLPYRRIYIIKVFKTLLFLSNKFFLFLNILFIATSAFCITLYIVS